MGYVKEQIRVIKERDPAIKTSIEVFLYPSFYALYFINGDIGFIRKSIFL